MTPIIKSNESHEKWNEMKKQTTEIQDDAFQCLGSRVWKKARRWKMMKSEARCSRCIWLLRWNFSSPFNFVKVLICHFSILRSKRVRVCWERNLSFLEQNNTAASTEGGREGGESDPTQPWKVCVRTGKKTRLGSATMHVLTQRECREKYSAEVKISMIFWCKFVLERLRWKDNNGESDENAEKQWEMLKSM